jgi:hypothetical protein
VIEADAEAIERVVEGMRQAGYYVDEGAALEALRIQGQFKAIDPVGGWKADLIVRKDRPFSRTEFARRRMESLLGVHVSLATLEDVVIAKLEWSKLGDSELQRRDVALLLERGRDQLDMEYLERWVGELDLETEWKRSRGGGR